MSCLTDIQIQAVVDGEASEANVAHAASCRRCADKVDARRRDMADVMSLLSADAGGAEGAEDVERMARMKRAITEGGAVRGSTALRDQPSRTTPMLWKRPVWTSALAAAAGIALVVYFVLPKLGSPTTLSAHEVLGRSLKTMSTNAGVEMLHYEFFAAGEMPGPHRIEQLIDHDRPGRYRFSNYGPDGALESAIGQDSGGTNRFHLIRVDGRNYIIKLGPPSAKDRHGNLSLPEMGQALIETTITMMQATKDQNLTTIDGPEGPQYVVEIPPVTPQSGAAMFDLHHARAVIDSRDFRILEYSASGSLLKQPFSVSFRLINRSVRPSSAVSPEEFTITPGPGDVVLTGASASDPVTDMLKTVLRELGRVKGS
jgi:hypothetical protein